MFTVDVQVVPFASVAVTVAVTVGPEISVIKGFWFWLELLQLAVPAPDVMLHENVKGGIPPVGLVALS